MMKTKMIFLIVYLVAGLLLGGAVEYVFFQSGVREDILSERREVNETAILSKDGKEDYEQRIHAYSLLSAEDILKELEKWNHAGLQQGFDWPKWSLRDYMAIRYLFYRLGVIAPEQGMKFKFSALDLDSVLTGHILYSWAEREPNKAFDFFLKNRERFSLQEPYLDKLVAQMVRNEPMTVWAEIDKLNDKERNDVLPVLWEQLMRDFPEKWEDFIPELEKRSLSRLKYLMMVARQWGKRDIAKVYELASSQPGDYRREIRIAGLAGMMEVDKEGATREFLRVEEGASPTPIIALTRTLSKKSSLESLKWVMDYGSDSDREDAKTEGVMGNDYFISQEVKEFVAKMPSRDLRDQCIEHMVKRYNHMCDVFSPLVPVYYVDSIEDTLDLAEQMELNGNRMEYLKRIYSDFLNEKGSGAVKEYLKKSRLPKVEKNRIKSNLVFVFGMKALGEDASYFSMAE